MSPIEILRLHPDETLAQYLNTLAEHISEFSVGAIQINTYDALKKGTITFTLHWPGDEK